MRILKFGGKSLNTKEKMQNICKYIKKIYKKDKKIIVVVSAIGKTTDELIAFAKHYVNENLTPRELDVLLSTGETQSSAIVAMMLNLNGIPAKSFQAFQIQATTFGAFQNSKIAHLNKENFDECFKQNTVAVVAGFQGINKKNEITTLGRGGSDTTAAAIGAVFNCDVEIYSDFDGVFCGDPRFLEFKKLKKLNHETMLSLALAGAKVLDHRAVNISKKFGFNIVSKSSTLPFHTGSLVSEIESDVVAISSIDELCKVSIVFSNESKLKFIAKNVIFLTNNFKFYNLTINSNKITFMVKQENKNEIIQILSKKLNLLK